MPKTSLSAKYGGQATVEENTIEMSDWSKAYVKTDAEVGYNFSGESDGAMRDRDGYKKLLYALLAAMLLGASAALITAFDREEIFGTEESNSVEEIVEMKNCSLEHHIEWYQKPIKKEDGQQYTEIAAIAHDPTSFTQGLSFADGKLYESTGLFKESKVRILDLDGGLLKTHHMDEKLFGEGMTVYHDKLVQITWKSHKGFVYDRETLGLIQEFTFETTNDEGWGITYDWCKDELVVTDGSAYLHFWDPTSFQEKRKVKVHRLSGEPATELNEIEYWRGRILANVWFEDVLLVINPDTGETEKEYDFSMLWPEEERKKKGADVFNGISTSDDEDVLYVTGKLWDKIYSVKLN